MPALKPCHLPALLPTALQGAGPSVLTSLPSPSPKLCPGPGGHLMLPRKVHLAQSPSLAPGLALKAPDLITGPHPLWSKYNSLYIVAFGVIWSWKLPPRLIHSLGLGP